MTLGTIVFEGFVQFLHSRQDSTISGIKSRTSLITPTALSTVVICVRVACHHLKCSFLSVSNRVGLFLDLRLTKLLRISKVDQSVGVGVPEAASRSAVLVLGSLSGPLPPPPDEEDGAPPNSPSDWSAAASADAAEDKEGLTSLGSAALSAGAAEDEIFGSAAVAAGAAGEEVSIDPGGNT